VSQVQQAAQASVTVQTLGTSAQQAKGLDGQPSLRQLTGTITQIQIGCLSKCFGTTSTGTSPEAMAEQILAELSSLAPPAGSTSLQPVPGSERTVVDQTICQVQTGQAAGGTQIQTASQSSTTVQLINLASTVPPSLASSVPASVASPPRGSLAPVVQAAQLSWQLQIGCLFYCADTQQVQLAQQTITTTQVLVEQRGPTGVASSTPLSMGAVAVANQVIWQLQIGCLAWCYDATQVQDATSQTTVAVITTVPPVDTPPPAAPPPAGSTSPLPAPGPGGTGSGSHTAESTGEGDATPTAASAASTPPSAPSTPPSASAASGASAATPLLTSTSEAGLAILDRWSNALPAITPAPPEAALSRVSLPTPRITGRRNGSVAFASTAGHPIWPRTHRLRRAVPAGILPGPAHAGIPPLPSPAAAPGQPNSTLLIVLLVLALAAVAALTASGLGHGRDPAH
jgi:hypothetical protein